MADKVEVIYTREAWDRLWAYIGAVSGEIGGLGYATAQDGFILVDKVFLIPQIRSSGHVDFADHEYTVTLPDGGDCDDAMSWALEKAVADDRVEDMRFSWHSHGSISVCWSSTDEEAIGKYGMMTPWLVSAVLNREGKMLTRLDVFNTPLIGHVTMKDLKSSPVPNTDMVADVTTEVAAVTAEKTYPSTQAGGKTGTGSSGQSQTQTKNGNRRGNSGSQRQLPPGRSYKGPFANIKASIVAGDGIGLIHDPSDKNSKYNPHLIKSLEDDGFIILDQADGCIYALSPDGVTV